MWLVSVFPALAQPEPDFKALYQDQQWFRLRDAVQSAKNPPLFYRGVVAAAFNRHDEAVKDLVKVYESTPGSWEAKQAEALLRNIFNINGQYDRFVHEWGRQRVVKLAPSRGSYTYADGFIKIPASINGKAVNYIMDTGAGQSMVTKSEAKWLGLKLLHSSVDATDVWSGKTAKTSEIGVARRLAIGRAELRNVLFVIVPDDNALVQDQPAGKRGIIGLPVLFALETVRWDAAGNFETGTRLPPPEARTRVLCLVGDNVAVEVQCEGKRIVLVLDTGIGFTVLGSRFHDEFRALVDASANKSTRQMIGSFGDTDRASVTLPLKFDVGGFESALSEVPVLLDDRAGGGHGTIGLDLLKQAQVVTIDFRSMSLTLEGHTATVASH